MNAPTKSLPAKVAVTAGGQVAALIPQSMEEAFRVANAIAASGLAPRGLDKPEQVLVAIMAGAELGLAPFQSLQSIAVVNGRPTLWGDGLVAIARAQGVQIDERIEGDGEAMVARCVVTRPDSGEVIERAFSVDDAKRAKLWMKRGRDGGDTPWVTYPRRMLAMRARAWALRDGCADMLRGFQVREEVEDYQTIREVRQPEGTGMRARLEARQPVGGFDPEHVATELQEAEVEEVVSPLGPNDVGRFDDDLDRIVTADDLPAGLKTGAQVLAEQEAAEQSEADQGAGGANNPAGDGPGQPSEGAAEFDVLAWAGVLLRSLPDYAGVDVLRADWDEHKAELQAKSPGLFKELNTAVVARAKEVEAGRG